MGNGESYQNRHIFFRRAAGLLFVYTGAIHNSPQRRTKGPTPRFTRARCTDATRPTEWAQTAAQGLTWGKTTWAAPCGRRAPPICDCECLFWVACVQSIPRLLLQPPLEVLPAPASMVVETALGDLDVLIRFADYNYYMAVAAVVVADQVAGADLIPAWVVHPPPREVSKCRVRTQCSPAGAVGAPVVGPAAGGAIGLGYTVPVG